MTNHLEKIANLRNRRRPLMAISPYAVMRIDDAIAAHQRAHKNKDNDFYAVLAAMADNRERRSRAAYHDRTPGLDIAYIEMIQEYNLLWKEHYHPSPAAIRSPGAYRRN